MLCKMSFFSLKEIIFNIWWLVPKADYVNIIRTKWIFKNKIDERGCVTKN